MKKIWTVAFSLLAILGAYGQKAPATENLDEMDKNQLLLAVPLGDRGKLVGEFQTKEGIKLFNGPLSKLGTPNEKITVEKLRNGEVLVVTIPASLLFLPNETVIRSDASAVLQPFLRYLRNPDMYWMILDMHSDNTGNEDYTDNLTLDRVESVFNWFENQEGVSTQYLFPTASGASEPLPGNPNISMKNRARNRRLEIYLVPGKKMLEAAKKGRIVF